MCKKIIKQCTDAEQEQKADKSKKEKVVESKKGNNNNAMSGKNKKKNNKNNRGMKSNYQQPAQKNQYNKKGRKVVQEVAIIEEPNEKQEDPDQETPLETNIAMLNNENLQLLESQERMILIQNCSLDERQPSPKAKSEHSKEKSKKVVAFRLQGDTESEEEVKVPKRGSSRGSSCVEEAIHQNTITMLGDLFPQEYKNPSLDTKIRISEITSSSNNTGSQFSSPEMNAIGASPELKLNKSIVQSSSKNEEVLETFTNQNKKKQSNREEKKSPMVNAQRKKQPKNDKHYENYEAMFQ